MSVVIAAHMARVIVVGMNHSNGSATFVDPWAWDAAYGGEAKTDDNGWAHLTPLKVKRLRTDDTLPLFHWYMTHAGDGVMVYIEHMANAKKSAGFGLAYAGKLTNAIPAPFDANSADLSYDRLVIKCSRVEMLNVDDVHQLLDRPRK